MSDILQASSSFLPPPLAKAPVAEIVRRSGNYHPCVWGDHFLSYSSPSHAIPDIDTQKELEVAKEEVRKILLAAADNQPRQLKIIDDIQRLGVAYHYEAEIDEALTHINGIYDEFCGTKSDQDLHIVALCFRLLRQRGHNVSSDVFNKFKDESKGLFKQSLRKDVEGLLSLYEAAHLSVHGEDILDEALTFTTSHLEHLKTELREPVAAQVIHALQIPVWRSINRSEARHYISIYGKTDSHNKTLLYFAKLDFNLLQKLYQSELANISRWWMNLNLKEKLPFARDRWVESYFWILGMHFEPRYLLARKLGTKMMALMVVLDDIYDLYGTLEEVTLFTEVIERWDISGIDRLPEYMRCIYGILLDVYAETEEELSKAGLPLHRVQYGKNSLKELTRSYLFEANCFYKGLVPKVEEYIENALVSTSVPYLATNFFMGLGDNIATQETLDWISSFPLVSRAGSLICRLIDDMNEYEAKKAKKDKETIDTAGAVDCYMKQYGASKEDAFLEFRKQIDHAWKDINSEFIRPSAVQMCHLEAAFNMTRVTYLMYQDKNHGFTTAATKTKAILTPVLVDPIPI